MLVNRPNERHRHFESRSVRRLVLLLTLAALALLGLMPPTASATLRSFPAILAAGVCILAARQAVSALAPAAVVLGITALMAAGLLWQLALPLAILGATAVARYFPESAAPAVERGQIPVGLTLFAGFVTPAALLGWVYFMNPDVSDLTSMIAEQPLGLLILGGVVFALANATFEEWVWRGILQPSLQQEFGVPWAISIQAISFGIAHAYGFPRGAVGVLLAGTWAVILGILRHVGGGLLAPVLAHIVADAAIAGIVIFLARAG